MLTRSRSVRDIQLPIKKSKRSCSVRSCSVSTRSESVLIDMAQQQLHTAPFSRADPESWFRQLEAIFTFNKIADDEMRYVFVQARLDPVILSEIADFFQIPPVSDRYEALKSRIIKQYAVSRDKQVTQLLEGLTLGDRSPSDLLREMKRMAKDDISDDVLRPLFINQLPDDIRKIVAGSNDPLHSIGQMADRIINYGSSKRKVETANISAVELPPVSYLNPQMQLLNTLVDNVAKLSLRVSELESRSSYQHRSRSRSTRSSSPSHRGTSQRRNSEVPMGLDLCYYHYRFGKNAKKCKTLDDGKPCNMKPLNS